MSAGDGKAARKKRPRILAITTDCCTGCAGSPACIEYCPIEACMFWVSDEDHPPFGHTSTPHSPTSPPPSHPPRPTLRHLPLLPALTHLPFLILFFLFNNFFS